MDPRTAERFFRITCAAMFVFGTVLGVPGTVVALPEFVERLQLSIPERGTLISSLFFGLLVGSALSGPIVDRFGRRPSLVVSAVLVAACLPVVAAAPSFPWAAAALAALGLSSAGVNTASNAIASELFPAERGRRMNAIALAVGTGGLLLPATTAALASRVPWEAIIAGAAVLAAGVAVAAARTAVPPQVGFGSPIAWRDVATVIRQPGVGAFSVMVALAAAHEATLSGWTTTYLASGGVPAGTAAWGLAIFWAGLIGGRLVLARRVDRDRERAVVLAALAGAASVLVIVLVRLPPLMIVAPGLAGFAIALVMPTTLAVAGERYPRHAGTLFGLLLTLAQAGAMVLPGIVGLAAGAIGLRPALSILVGTHVVLALVMRRARPVTR